MSFLTSIFGKMASESHLSGQQSQSNAARARRNSIRTQVSLMDQVGRFEVRE